MRIVAGQLKGRHIEAPEGRSTRPTTDRIRESLMSSLISRLPSGSFEDLVVCDAFAGSGALGMEALSRGAKRCVFIERDGQAFSCLRKNLSTLGLSDSRAYAFRYNVFDADFRRLAAGFRFDVVFCDPPYATCVDDVFALIGQLVAADVLAHDALIVYEHARDAGPDRRSEDIDDVEILITKEHGKTGVTVMRVNESGRGDNE